MVPSRGCSPHDHNQRSLIPNVGSVMDVLLQRSQCYSSTPATVQQGRRIERAETALGLTTPRTKKNTPPVSSSSLRWIRVYVAVRYVTSTEDPRPRMQEKKAGTRKKQILLECRLGVLPIRVSSSAVGVSGAKLLSNPKHTCVCRLII